MLSAIIQGPVKVARSFTAGVDNSNTLNKKMGVIRIYRVKIYSIIQDVSNDRLFFSN